MSVLRLGDEPGAHALTGSRALGCLCLVSPQSAAERMDRTRRAGTDPEFIAEMRGLEADFDGTIAGGFDDGDAPNR
jgi:hypothetical protein